MKLTVEWINNRAKANPVEFIKEAEHQYHDEVRSVADAIIDNPENKIIMIAGPSSSGKTTTALLLRDTLRGRGIDTHVVSLDDFYLNRSDSPRDENGEPDYETVYALDIPEIKQCFTAMVKDGIYDVPQFDFVSGTRKPKRKTVDIRNGGLLIVEGLHALNPVLSDYLPNDSLLRIYISVNRAIYDNDGKKVLSSKKMRLARRMSRDYIYRNTTPQATFDMWDNVLRGETKYLYCYKDTADIMLTTLHWYEPCILRDDVINLLSQVDKNSEDYETVEATVKGLSQFVSIPQDLVPQESLIREFIKGGKYE